MSTFSLCSPCKFPIPLRHRFDFSFSVDPICIRFRNPSQCLLSASVAEGKSTLEVSWGKLPPDDYNGWAIDESPPEPLRKKGLSTLSVIGVGTSVAAVLGLFAYCSISNKGFGSRLRHPFVNSNGLSCPSLTVTDDIESDEVSLDVVPEDSQVPEENINGASDAFVTEDTSFHAVKEQKPERIIVPQAVDSAQQEALFVLKTLTIIGDDVRADELCTRREYARWLVRANSQLERSREHRISTSAALSGLRVAAFDDVQIEDPDFESIQSLAESGVVKSKLSDKNGGFAFFPDRFISHQDLISWKAKIEYKVTSRIDEEMSRRKIGFLDAKDISSDALVDLFLDILADEKSITRGVFGQSKRFQPSKPCTKGQAAVALASGRTTEFIYSEISRLEAEAISRQTETEEIMSELLERGDITHYWEEKMEEEKKRGTEVETSYLEAVTALEQEKILRESSLAEMLKQNAALDCQNKLLSGLKDEVKEMSERLVIERDEYIDERNQVQDFGNELRLELEGIIDRKSILEAEVEALRILRSWVEEEARKSKARAKVLEEAGRRWRWDM